MSRANADQQNLRDLLDAIRLCLGKDPIYRQVKTTYFSIEMTVDPLKRPAQEWFTAGGAVPDETRSRDQSVAKAMKKLAGQRVRGNPDANQSKRSRYPHPDRARHNEDRFDFRDRDRS